MSSVYRYTMRPAIQLLPQFDRFNPTRYLVAGRLLGWSVVGKAAFLMILLKSGIAMVAALVIFSRREIAKITV
jgi:hypothetical protein